MAPHRAPVVIDTDPGVDDALALLLAARCPEIEVLAVQTVGGNLGLQQVTENARRILRFAWETPPPLMRGRETGGATAAEVHGQDGLSGLTTLLREDGSPAYPCGPDPAAADPIAALPQLARSRPGQVTVVALGPMTNLAHSIRLDPEGMRCLRRVVVMGGAFRVPGNYSATGEFNVAADPEAAVMVCDSGIPLLWVPLDVSEKCLLTPIEMGSLPGPTGEFVRRVTEDVVRFHEGTQGEAACCLHDPLALAVAVRADLVQTRSLRVDVETAGRHTRGQTVADFRPHSFTPRPPPNAEVALTVDAAGFLAFFLDRLRM